MKKILSYILIGFIWLYALLPLGVLYLFSDLTFLLLYHIIGYRRKVVYDNLTNAFPEKSTLEKKEIERKFYRHLCDYFFETIKLVHISEKEIKKRITSNSHILNNYYDKKRNVIGMLGHSGNWEWLTSIAMGDEYHWAVPYHPLHSSPYFDAFMKKTRSRFGAEPVAMKQTYKRLMEIRNSGELFMAGMVSDQSPPNPNNRHWIDFMNQDTAVMEGSERIARKTDSVVVFCKMIKLKRGYYQVDLIPLTEKISEENEFSITEKYYQMLEEQIREQPECWLWSHRRWKRKRPTDARKIRN